MTDLLTPDLDHRRLPVPAGDRFQPLRAGIVNIWQYDQQELWFAGGRLILRGENGMGKSKALEVLLPFLFDADLRPHRLDPFGGTSKTMKWNLLEGGVHANRLGYVWLELGRVGDDGEPEYLTLGAGLHASGAASSVGSWYFETGLRMGADVDLVTANVPLTRELLKKALGERGTVFDQGRDYRVAVDTALFGLGPDRYDALVHLLLQLRRPQLSAKLDPGELSKLLADGLPPLDGDRVGQLAKGFEGLDRDASDLGDLQRAKGSVDRFVDDYRDYARRIARRRAADLRQAETKYHNALEAQRSAEEALAAAVARLEQLRLQRDDLAAQASTVQGTIEALDKSEAMRAVEALREAESAADRAEKVAGEEWKSRATAERELGQAVERADRARVEADGRRALVTPLLAIAAGAAADTGLAARHDAHVAGIDADPVSVRVALVEAAGERRRQADELRGLEGAVEAARAELRAARERADDAADRVAAAERRRLDAQRQLEAAADAIETATVEWAGDLVELMLSAVELEALVGSVRAAGSGDGGPEPSALLDAAATPVRESLAASVATVEGRRSALQERRAALEDEQRDLERGVEAAPVAVPTRPAARHGRAGAPLYQLVDFVEGLSDGERAGVEAALEGAGLLDAWVTVDGLVLDAGTLDAFALPCAAVDGPSLADVLVLADAPAAVDAPTRALVTELLRSIGFRAGTGAGATNRTGTGAGANADTDTGTGAGAGVGTGAGTGTDTGTADGAGGSTGATDTEAGAGDGAGAGVGGGDDRNGDNGADLHWVGTDGRYRLGPLQGAFAKSDASFIGAGAREAARRRRLAEIASELAEVAAGELAVDTERAALDSRRHRLNEEVSLFPPSGSVVEARAALSEATRSEEARRAELSGRERAVVDASASFDRAAGALTTRADELGMAGVLGGLSELIDALDRYRGAVVEFTHAVEVAVGAEQRAAEMADAEREAGARAGAAVAKEQAALSEARTRRAHFDTLRATVGAEADELLARRRREVTRLHTLEEADRAAEAHSLEAREQRGSATAQTESATADVEERADARASAAEGVRRLVAVGFLAAVGVDVDGDAGEPGTWSLTRLIETARALESVCADADIEVVAVDRSSKQVHARFQELLQDINGAVYQPYIDPAGDVLVVRVTHNGRDHGIAELAQSLAVEVAHREELLHAEERRLLERVLLGDLGDHLRARMREARELVDEMNAQLAGRRTASGMTLKLSWQTAPDAAAGTASAVDLLMRAEHLSDGDREALSRFLQGCIDSARASIAGGTWQEQLLAALDYRRWHRFRVIRVLDGKETVLGAREHGTGSGGERAVSLHLPLFAAAAAQYRFARPTAPRVVLLDEAFAGIDTGMRGSLMGLLVAFDLDFIMTSHEEWGCYEELPSVATYNLYRDPTMRGVAAVRFVWNGDRLDEDDPAFEAS